jgi:hypothetical protein
MISLIIPCRFLIEAVFFFSFKERARSAVSRPKPKMSILKGISIFSRNKKMVAEMQLNNNLKNDEFMDAILREAAEGYGDLRAAAQIHNVSMTSLQARAKELRIQRTEWIL